MDAVVAPRWTARIHAEWIGNLVAQGKVSKERLELTLDLMNRALPDADVRDWEAHMGGLALPDPDDCHVLAAALAADAGTILTMNFRDFPSSALTPYGVTAVHPDEFLYGLHEADPELLLASTEAAHANLSGSLPSWTAYLDVLDRQGLPKFARNLRL